MYKIIVYKEVGTGEWETSEGTRFPETGICFMKTLELPFAPSIGIDLRLSNWLSGPLERVSCIINENEAATLHFACWAIDDNKIPDTLDDMFERGDKKKERDKWRDDTVELLKDFYINSFHWELVTRESLDKKNQWLEMVVL